MYVVSEMWSVMISLGKSISELITQKCYIKIVRKIEK